MLASQLNFAEFCFPAPHSDISIGFISALVLVCAFVSITNFIFCSLFIACIKNNAAQN